MKNRGGVSAVGVILRKNRKELPRIHSLRQQRTYKYNINDTEKKNNKQIQIEGVRKGGDSNQNLTEYPII